jgi:Zn-dependent protease
MRRWYYIGYLRKSEISLYAHWSVLLAVAILAASTIAAPLYALVSLGSVVALVLIHELGHAFIAHRLGYEVDELRFGLVHGRCSFEAPSTQLEESLIAWGGVAAQLCIAVPLLLLDVFWSGQLGLLGPVVLILGYWSLFTAAFNLLPLRGLDGRLAWHVLPSLKQSWNNHRIVRSAIRRAARK